MDELTELAIKYNTDKWGKHTYTPYYYDVFKDRKHIIKKVLEIGTAEGASLLMWRDFFPNATIYGAEIDPERVKLMDGQERIKVFQCDQTKEQDLMNVLAKVGEDVDIVIDDGSHVLEDQVFSCKTLMPHLQKHVIYIIEDIQYWYTASKRLAEYQTECAPIIQSHRIRKDNRLLIVRHQGWPK